MSSSNLFIRYQRAFADTGNGDFWHEVTADLTPWAGQVIDISWDFGSSSRNNEAGWYIDDIAIRRPDYSALSQENITSTPDGIEFSIFPNPFNTACKISMKASSKIDVIEIFDISGRLVKKIKINIKGSIEDNEIVTIWDCRDDSGKYLPSGIYLIKPKNRPSQKAILIR